MANLSGAHRPQTAASSSTRPETTDADMTRLRRLGPEGRAPRRQGSAGQVGRPRPLLAALRNDGIEAPCLFDGPINGERFHAYVEQFLAPTLKPERRRDPSTTSARTSGKAVRRAIRDIGARLVFLPKYSPDLNPIEQVFAKFKTLLRKSGAEATKPDIPEPALTFSRQYPPEAMRRIHQERRLCVKPNAGCYSAISGALGY